MPELNPTPGVRPRDDWARENDAAMVEANVTVLGRSKLTDPHDNLRTLDAGLLWRLMQVTDPQTFRHLLAEAVEFATPDPDLGSILPTGSAVE